MTTQRSRLTDHDIERFLRTRAADPDPALWSDIMGAAGATAQRAGLWARWIPPRPLVALLVAGLLLAALAGSLVVGSGLLRPRPPTPPAQVDHANWFVRDFEYSIAADSGLEPDARQRLIHSFEGSGRGVVVFAVQNDSNVEGCGGGHAIRTGTPTEVLEDLRAIGGVGVGAPTSSTLDGRPAITADVDPLRQQCDVAHIHLTASVLSGIYVPLDRPARLIFADVDGRVVGVQIWAEQPDELDAWIPMAMEFVDTIHFAPSTPSTP